MIFFKNDHIYKFIKAKMDHPHPHPPNSISLVIN